MVEKTAEDARARKAAKGEVEGQGRDAFRAAGMEDVLRTRGTVDVGTKWMEPVEYIQPKVHTEYTTIIDREIHKHHLYPCVQPVEDPNPIVLEPRHHIFSVVDGKVHEVEGDAAAIEMMGQEAFEHGQKEVTHVRSLVLVEEISEAGAERSETMS
ncbi:hypothetical protein EHS25_004800 [Saitozyma podzolica]|uniref:Uncharacterized protein n=1 Tax=Saitozyma podzolica TaxID=1890683 RepID=A0A427Y2Q0_9TREE|nr:hypothetical protein EHS25_004800 [Saitozyma podzolica]